MPVDGSGSLAAVTACRLRLGWRSDCPVGAPGANIYQTATSSEDAAAAFDDWCSWVDTYDIPEGHRLAGTVRSWLAEVLAYFDTRLTNGRTEGKNLIIKQVKRQGFGYRNPNHYRTRVLYRCA